MREELEALERLFKLTTSNKLKSDLKKRMRKIEGVFRSQGEFTKAQFVIERLRPDLEYITDEVAKEFNFDPDILSLKTRKHPICMARFTAMKIIKDLYGDKISLNAIGWFFGNRDHSTVINALTKSQDAIDSDRTYKAHFENVKSRIELKLRAA